MLIAIFIIHHLLELLGVVTSKDGTIFQNIFLKNTRFVTKKTDNKNRTKNRREER
jgi:hypothetical protein